MSRHKLASSSGESCSAGEAGHWPQHDDGPYDSNIGWTANHKGDYIDLAHTGSFALAINNYNDAAGRDYAPTGPTPQFSGAAFRTVFCTSSRR